MLGGLNRAASGLSVRGRELQSYQALNTDTSRTAVLGPAPKIVISCNHCLSMTSESDLSDRLTVQSLATITIGGVSLAMKYLRNTQSRLIKLVDNLLHSSAMLVSSLFLSALQVSRPTSGSCLLYMVCLSLVSFRANHPNLLLIF